MIPEPAQHRVRFVTAYTAYLYVVAMFGLVMVFSHQMLLAITTGPEPDAFFVSFFRLLQVVDGVVFVGCLTTAALRSVGLRHAVALTTAVSVFLAIWFPLGTAAFIWWVGWIRRKERDVKA